MEILYLLLNMVICILFIVIQFVGLYFTIKHSANKARKENMSKIDFSRDKEYYRTILKTYSSAELSYIDDFKVNYKREIVATILSLELKGKVRIENDGIRILDNNDENLRKTERFILKSIDNGKVKITDSGYIESYAQDEAIEDALIIKNTDKIGKKRVIKKILCQLILCLISILIFFIFASNCEKLNDANSVIKIIGTILGFVAFFIIWIEIGYGTIGIFIYYLMQINSYRRTEKGEEINKNIEGLKQYIKDYSLLKDKDKEALRVWEEYLIYSVIFDINDENIVKKIFNFVEIEFERGKIYFQKV